MEIIGNQEIWSYIDGSSETKTASTTAIRKSEGHQVKSYFDLAMKIARLQYLNRDHVLLFRGQSIDFKTRGKESTLKPSIFRSNDRHGLSKDVLERRFAALRKAEEGLVSRYSERGLLGGDRLKRQRIIRWAILQHYEVCRTPLLDVTQSLRIGASFASIDDDSSGQAFLFVFGVPNVSGAITASSEASLQVVRLASACPPDAVRPHLQEGYLLGEYPEVADYTQNSHYPSNEMDFGRRLVAKFRFDSTKFWSSKNFPLAPIGALYPKDHRDPLLQLTDELKASLPSPAA